MESTGKGVAIYKKKLSCTWLKKDQLESVMSAQSLNRTRIVFVGRGQG